MPSPSRKRPSVLPLQLRGDRSDLAGRVPPDVEDAGSHDQGGGGGQGRSTPVQHVAARASRDPQSLIPEGFHLGGQVADLRRRRPGPDRSTHRYGRSPCRRRYPGQRRRGSLKGRVPHQRDHRITIRPDRGPQQLAHVDLLRGIGDHRCRGGSKGGHARRQAGRDLWPHHPRQAAGKPTTLRRLRGRGSGGTASVVGVRR